VLVLIVLGVFVVVYVMCAILWYLTNELSMLLVQKLYIFCIQDVNGDCNQICLSVKFSAIWTCHSSFDFISLSEFNAIFWIFTSLSCYLHQVFLAVCNVMGLLTVSEILFVLA